MMDLCCGSCEANNFSEDFLLLEPPIIVLIRFYT